jgi:hypothetical protein
MRDSIRDLLRTRGWKFWEDQKNRSGRSLDFVAVEYRDKDINMICHGIELEPSLERALSDPEHGVHQLSQHQCNSLWLGVPKPKGARNSSEDIVRLRPECAKRGYGLIEVEYDSEKEEYVARIALEPQETKGVFIEEYPSIWEELTKDAVGD